MHDYQTILDVMLLWETWVVIGVGVGVTTCGFVVTLRWLAMDDPPPRLRGLEPVPRSKLRSLVRRLRWRRPEPVPHVLTADRPTVDEMAIMLESMVDEAVKVHKEMRNSPRRWGDPREVRIKLPDERRLCGVVINRSEGGVALLLDEKFALDLVVAVRATEAPADVPWINVQVRHCRKAGRNWLVGCQYQESPPWNVLVWFG